MPARQVSASSFAEEFDAARNRLTKLDFEQEQEHEPGHDHEDESPMASPSLSSSDSLTSEEPSPLESDNGENDDATPFTPMVDPDSDNVADNFAFAFDIDGVLVRGGKPIPEAIEAMKVLNGENEYGIKVPYIFLTNGGGKFESERCADLSRQLDMTVSEGQFICGHTPMRELSSRYRDCSVLVVGGEGETCRLVAESYGFHDVITPGDILKANASTAPFRRLTPAEHAASRDLLFSRGRGRRHRRHRPEVVRKLSDIVISAVFVFADSRDWASDLQIILDVAQSRGGRLETRSETFDEGPPIYFSHSDVVWSAAHEHVRLGMGALRKMVETVFEETTGGKKLVTHAFGKPQVGTFEFAERLLRQWRAEKHGLGLGTLHGRSQKPAVRTVYFVGDTPESDIKGTNAMDEKSGREGTEWYSILVKTGVYQEGTEPRYRPRKLVDNVLDAVHHGIRREMARKRTTSGGRLLSLDEDVFKNVGERRMPEIVERVGPFSEQ
ncbi:phosphatidyl synthase [Neurospora crassa OR74A]|uniref:Phosphatidyl synthase n=1 Tax=Neurospora crassa (strain ATCC 24698 / 74-OR23-1A / CBS 708.71 / DSM 1257 / FGSC 987) TaxID=367110 RepID=Q7S5M5_NEUCR|nr:phosphatidyl synthase [Neurospora crassa OR74A]EAA30842.2 phosphatidyl synthase [Neurospora crassa OR74A]|eukprot:XP_960078.2 phosphatidyl synthase [Neurospora crassa OR74A]